jgi:transcriptional regulator with XRE-family HTH domain
METTLKALRDNADLTLEQAAVRLATDFPGLGIKTYAGVANLERRGTDRLPVLRALASIYGVTLEEVEVAAMPARQKDFAKKAIFA